MENKVSRYVCAMWIMAAIFIVARYLCASIMVAGALGDRGTYNMALDALGPFLPLMSIICLAGGLLFLVADLIATKRKK